MQKPIFLVMCERIGKRNAYKVSFPYHPQVVERIKNLPQEDRKWNTKEKSWEVSTGGLYTVIKSYRKSKKIYFDFGNDNGRKTFISLVEKHKKKEEEHRLLLIDLEKKKKYWIKWKKELEENYLKYWDQLHKHLKRGVKLYPHQVVAAMFLNETKSALISHDMGIGKAQDLDSKLVTPNGLVRMGDIKVGDEVIGSDGKPKKVLGVYPQGWKDIYEITFNDGVTTRSCDEHLWNVNTTSRNFRGNPHKSKTFR